MILLDDSSRKAYPIDSDEVEPVAALIFGRLFMRCKVAPNHEAKKDAYAHLWWGINAMASLAGAIQTAEHLSVSCDAHIRSVAAIIVREFGIDPMTHPDWKTT